MQVYERVRIMSELAEQGSFSVAAVQSAYGLSYADARSVVGEMERLRMVKTDEDGAYHLTPYGKDVAERMFVGDDSERVKRLLCEKILMLTCPDMKAPECATDYNKDISEICEEEEEDDGEEYDEEYEYDGYDEDESDEEYEYDGYDARTSPTMRSMTRTSSTKRMTNAARTTTSTTMTTAITWRISTSSSITLPSAKRSRCSIKGH